ncbi:MAG: ribosome biogenesis GTP-binding protein YihA/YsxC [Chitinivibrionales bacterium]
MDSNNTARIQNAEFLLSAATKKDFPEPSGAEYCLLGRSNVGKSSFINHVLENRKLAMVSKKPGKTSLANFFRITDDLFWVDLPGYGYAKTSKSEKMRWSKLIADYCTQRENLAGIIWLLDIRHPGTDADRQAHQWLRGLNLPFFPVFTKCDKIKRSKYREQSAHYHKLFNLPHQGVFYSTEQHDSRARFWSRFEEWRRKMGTEC